jgi:hypothetical protein
VVQKQTRVVLSFGPPIGRRPPSLATHSRAFLYERRVLRLQVLQLTELDGCQDARGVGVLRTEDEKGETTSESQDRKLTRQALSTPSAAPTLCVI